jgi:RNA polymerase sigma factor for flagellar operon FliA
MNEDELRLWKRYSQGNEAAHKELILSYLYLAKIWARRISRIASWANQEDLLQEGVIGLINAIRGFDPSRDVPFERYANQYIRGAILDSSELTRELTRRQQEICRIIKHADAELTRVLQRNPTIEEVADETGLSVEQMTNAICAMGIAFAREPLDAEEPPAPIRVELAQQERTIVIQDALSRLSKRERSVVICYYWEDQSHEEIARRLELTVSNATKIRQRAIRKLRKELGAEGDR